MSSINVVDTEFFHIDFLWLCHQSAVFSKMSKLLRLVERQGALQSPYANAKR
jgi:hypothetical protein